MVSRTNIVANGTSLLQTGAYSDLLIRCDGTEFKAHKAIVCPQSHFFASAFNGNFKEAETAVITLVDENAETIHRVLSFLYTADFDDMPHVLPELTADVSKPNEDAKDAELDEEMEEDSEGTAVEDSEVQSDVKAELESHCSNDSHPIDYEKLSWKDRAIVDQILLRNNILVYKAADKFGIHLLKNRVVAKLKERLKICAQLPDLLKITDGIYRSSPSTDRTLHDLFLEKLYEYRMEWLDDTDLNDPKIRDVLVGNGELAFELLHKFCTKNEDARSVQMSTAMENADRAKVCMDAVTKLLQAPALTTRKCFKCYRKWDTYFYDDDEGFFHFKCGNCEATVEEWAAKLNT